MRPASFSRKEIPASTVYNDCHKVYNVFTLNE
jgi:hypothetical protein